MTSNGFLESLETSSSERILEGTVGKVVRSFYLGEVGQDRLLHRQLREIYISGFHAESSLWAPVRPCKDLCPISREAR
jgi:hypothetical protein